MANDTTVFGLALVRINGTYELDVKSGSFSGKQTVLQHVTGKGVRNARGITMPSGSLEEVIPRSGATAWKNLKNFTMEIVDKETKSTIALAEGCEWEDLGIRFDLAQASMLKSVSWKGSEAVTF